MGHLTRGNLRVCSGSNFSSFDKTSSRSSNGTIIGRNGVVCCLRMTALRPVIVVPSSVQKPATSARRDSARIDRPAPCSSSPRIRFCWGMRCCGKDDRSEGLLAKSRWATLSADHPLRMSRQLTQAARGRRRSGSSRSTRHGRRAPRCGSARCPTSPSTDQG
jgi:hypothetical protein